MTVTRMAHIDGRGRILSIRTEKAGEVQIYVPEKGAKIDVSPQGDSKIGWWGQ